MGLKGVVTAEFIFVSFSNSTAGPFVFNYDMAEAEHLQHLLQGGGDYRWILLHFPQL